MRVLTNTDRQKVLREALNWVGVPYKLLGGDRAGVDCSRLVISVYKNALGLNLLTETDRLFLASWLYKKFRVIPVESLQIGDLVFYCQEPRPKKRAVTSVAIYIGNNQVVHASVRLGQVAIENLYDYPGIILTNKDPQIIEQWLEEFYEEFPELRR